ncbi:MAG TPA: DNA-binding response regulator, partial [Dysgonomonas sp.]|nr:DNA-binding response regulator [Dysgonomonas sp.]
MKCIIVDDEPLARNAIQRHIASITGLNLAGQFSSTANVGLFLKENEIDLIFLDIEMPGVNGIDFAKTIPPNTLVIFTTAYPQYALDSYEVDAVDYLVKPIESERFRKAVNKAFLYHALLKNNIQENIENIEAEYIFVKSEKRFSKVYFRDILFVEGLKDYVIIQTGGHRIITRMYLKIIQEHLPNYF